MVEKINKSAGGEKLTIEEIRDKGKSQGLSYVQSLSSCFFEEIMRWVERSDLKDRMWLKPEEFYLKGKGRGTEAGQMTYYMKDISYTDLEEMVSDIQRQKRQEQVSLDWQLLFYDLQLEIGLSLKVTKVLVPFRIVVRPVWQADCFPEEEVYQPIFGEFEPVSYKTYPEELNLAECFFEMMEKLELIGDMRPYGEALRILKTRSVDGRRVSQYVKELQGIRKMTSWEKRWETVAGYGNYTYMKKRWDKYRKRDLKINRRESGDKEVSWSELMVLLKEFFTPLWESIQKDQIFLGDWMPQLGKYL